MRATLRNSTHAVARSLNAQQGRRINFERALSTSSGSFDAILQDSVKEIEAWWANERFQETERPYTALDVAQFRGSLDGKVSCWMKWEGGSTSVC